MLDLGLLIAELGELLLCSLYLGDQRGLICLRLLDLLLEGLSLFLKRCEFLRTSGKFNGERGVPRYISLD